MAVVDASIVVRLLQNRNDDDALRARFAELRELHAPTLIDAEVTSAVRGLMLASDVKLTLERATQMIDDYADLPILRYPVVPLQRRMLALRHNVTAYDGCYVALAEALDHSLLTDDSKFAGAPGFGVTIETWTGQGR